MNLNDPCFGCIHSKDEGCDNRDRIVKLLDNAKWHISENRYFTAAEILMAAGKMQMDFERRGFTQRLATRSPNCMTFISADEDFNKEANSL